MSAAIVDLNKLTEDERIHIIGTAATSGKRVGVLLESAALDRGKIERYVAKIKAAFPQVGVVERGPSGVANVEAVVFGLVQ